MLVANIFRQIGDAVRDVTEIVDTVDRVSRPNSQASTPRANATPAGSRAPARRLAGHTNPVGTISFSPDSRLLATGSGGTIKIWPTMPTSNGGRPLRTIEVVAFPLVVTSITFSPNGQTIVSTSTDRNTRLWNVQTGALIRTIDSTASAAAFSPNGQILASASSDKTVKLWNVQTGALIRTLPVNQASDSLSFSPDGRFLATSGYYDRSALIRLWNVETGSVVGTFQGSDDGVNDVNFSPNGQVLASANADKTISLWNVQTGAVIRKLEGHSRGVKRVSYHPNGHLLASIGFDNMVKIWDVRNGANVGNLNLHDRRGEADLAFSPNGAFFAFSSLKNTVTIIGPTERFQ
ncbi:WD40 repeat domain-containing protein [Desertifilum sp. FACHB-1129]|uniref:WD40 repeat domain-containing protein n=1 Tax=unclassified Desertifilum TaxID=2621682 RepID=UPI0016890898|nr:MULTISPECIES: WD40 repeat domain-containing protein [unclassified Desertifilum]MBD2311204.1 WD40 repeat domain-containing protein [Desertifilum sp. FACHB-1129]MBD2324351.1 WD40 repeat domain-containing protein [Desertifilum sp. FACHB-866]MBD2334365.1 WD40 repeat domain-containing protein [Desertifilum sp. FACHB-868]MDA0213212.1 WD40 repeat domain-containing protein [Cyanobacteria bacterium FC1]